jgi:hypothetical protein
VFVVPDFASTIAEVGKQLFNRRRRGSILKLHPEDKELSQLTDVSRLRDERLMLLF